MIWIKVTKLTTALLMHFLPKLRPIFACSLIVSSHNIKAPSESFITFNAILFALYLDLNTDENHGPEL
jgi:hypothetical protein